MGCAKKLCENKKKMNENHWIHIKERGATRIIFYSICAVVPVFITGVRNKEIECAFHFAESGCKQVLAFQKSWRSFSPIIVCILAHCMLPF